MKRRRPLKPKLYRIKIHRQHSDTVAIVIIYTVPATTRASALKFKKLMPNETVLSTSLIGGHTSTTEVWRKDP